MEKIENIENRTCCCQEREPNMWEKFIEKVKYDVYYRLIGCVYRHRDNKRLIKRFEKELNRQAKYYGNSFINDCRPELIKIFKKAINQGWSGSVAPYFIHSLAKTIEDGLNFRALSPLTLDKEEWSDLQDHGDRSHYQNKRNSAVFKDAKDNKPYYLYAFSKYTNAKLDIHTNTWTFRNPDESKICWSGSVYVIKKDALSKSPSKLTIDDVIFTSFGYIKDLEKFSNQSYQIPTVEILDSSDTHNDFICNYCLETDFPEDFFNIYEFKTRDVDPEDFKVIKKTYIEQTKTKTSKKK